MAGKTRKQAAPSEAKQSLIDQVCLMKLEGETTQAIATKLGLCWNTVDKYWSNVLASTADIDPIQLLKERRLVTEKILSKSLRGFYANKVPLKDLSIAFELADKFSGINQYLDKLVVTTQLPPLLEIIVQSVKLDLPPTNT